MRKENEMGLIVLLALITGLLIACNFYLLRMYNNLEQLNTNLEHANQLIDRLGR